MFDKSTHKHVAIVESVEGDAALRKNSNASHESGSTGMVNFNVEGVGASDLELYFATLSTEIKKWPVDLLQAENNPSIYLEGNNSKITRLPRAPPGAEDDSNNASDRKEIVRNWIEIMLKEGHIEVSQPYVGRIIGWPERSHSINSLYNDFLLWSRGTCVKGERAPTRGVFCSMLDQILLRRGDAYKFPPVAEAREKFAVLKEGVWAC